MNKPIAEIEDPGSIRVKITATYTIEQWTAISQALSEVKGWVFPVNEFRNTIMDFTHQANKRFRPEEK